MQCKLRLDLVTDVSMRAGDNEWFSVRAVADQFAAILNPDPVAVFVTHPVSLVEMLSITIKVCEHCLSDFI